MLFLKSKTKYNIPNLLNEKPLPKCICVLERERVIATPEEIEKYPYMKGICKRCCGKVPNKGTAKKVPGGTKLG